MAIKDIIKTRRKELGLTQEQIANYLGVTTPAVNKWENGITYPDIALLAPIARLLKTDVNTLLCFHEELTEQEINQFCMEVMNVIQKEGFGKGFELAQTKIDQYPNSTKLIHDIALLLDGAMIMVGHNIEDKDQYMDSILRLYERLTQSSDTEIRDSAVFMLASKYMNKKEYENAQELIDRLPKFSALDKRLLQANLYDVKGEYDDAKDIHERILINQVTQIWNHILSLMELEIKQGNLVYASKLANIGSQGAELYQLTDYYRIVPQLIVAAEKKDKKTCLELIESLLSSSKQSWNFSNEELYQHIKVLQTQDNSLEQDDNKYKSIDILPALIQQLKTDTRFEFLSDDERFKELLNKY